MPPAPPSSPDAANRSLAAFRKLVLASVVVIFVLIVIGGVVRATDSGLGCPDWPTCHGRLIPKLEKHTLIEYTHRATASVAGFMVLATAVWSWRSFRRIPALVLPATAALALIIVQAGLGGAAVLNELPPEVVAVHLGMALTITSILMLLWLTAHAMQRPLPTLGVSPSLAGLAVLTAGVAFALILVGSYVSGAGYGLACSGWPLCNGELVPSTATTSVWVHYVHRLLALFVGLLLLLLAWRSQRERGLDRNTALLPLLALLLFVVQALIGAANVWTQLADAVAAAHLAFATLVWLVIALFLMRLLALHTLLPRAWGPRRSAGLAEAAR